MGWVRRRGRKVNGRERKYRGERKGLGKENGVRGGKKDGKEIESKLRMVEEIEEKKERIEGDKEESKQKKEEKWKEVPGKNEMKKNRTGNRHRWAGAEGTKAEENQR